jgi:hypothetical protein
VASALTSVADWLVEPAARPVTAHEPLTLPPPVVAVAGLRRRAGVTTVARAVGAVLAGRDPSGACLVSSAAGTASVPLGLPAAARLGRRIAPVVEGRVRACGRLCLVEEADPAALCTAARELAPVVLDVAEPAAAAVAASLADRVVLVAGPEAEPALAAVVAESLGLVGPDPVVLLNRCGRASGDWAGVLHAAVPESRLAAQVAGAGREPRGPLGQAVAALVDGQVA